MLARFHYNVFLVKIQNVSMLMIEVVLIIIEKSDIAEEFINEGLDHEHFVQLSHVVASSLVQMVLVVSQRSKDHQLLRHIKLCVDGISDIKSLTVINDLIIIKVIWFLVGK